MLKTDRVTCFWGINEAMWRRWRLGGYKGCIFVDLGWNGTIFRAFDWSLGWEDDFLILVNDTNYRLKLKFVFIELLFFSRFCSAVWLFTFFNVYSASRNLRSFGGKLFSSGVLCPLFLLAVFVTGTPSFSAGGFGNLVPRSLLASLFDWRLQGFRLKSQLRPKKCSALSTVSYFVQIQVLATKNYRKPRELWKG